MAYRSDIDGLRAVAVVAVILFHLHSASLAGGYLGVDIFFVISGFLITTILARELGDRSFSLWHFYQRRLRRIGPALLVMMIVTSVGSVAVLLPVDLLGFARSLLATLAFVSNVYFWRDADYFSRIAGEKPLLHTWSLGIEEQFYILFPLILYIGFRMGRRAVAVLIVLLTFVSFTAAAVALKIGAGLPAFYLLPTRAWELGAGALIAFAPPLRLSARWAQGIAAAMLATIVASLVLSPGHLPPFVSPAFAPVVATALLIWIGEQHPTVASRLLGLRGATLTGCWCPLKA